MLPSWDAILDSGADCTTIPVEMAPQLEVNIDLDCVRQECKGVGGAAIAYTFPDGVVGRVLGERYPLRASFVDGLDIVLLGRMDFFDWHRVSFDQRAKTFTLTPYEERPDLPPLKPKGP